MSTRTRRFPRFYRDKRVRHAEQKQSCHYSTMNLSRADRRAAQRLFNGASTTKHPTLVRTILQSINLFISISQDVTSNVRGNVLTWLPKICLYSIFPILPFLFHYCLYEKLEQLFSWTTLTKVQYDKGPSDWKLISYQREGLPA